MPAISRTLDPSGHRRQCLYCTVREHSPCGGLRGHNSLDALEYPRSSPRRLKSGEAVSPAGERSMATYTVMNGMVAVSETLADGRHMILRFALPGDIVLCNESGREARTAVAVGDAIVCGFSQSRHEALMRDDPLYRARYEDAITRELHLAYDHLIEVALGNARQRVAALLYELACRRLRREPTASDRVLAPLTQIQIGLATGLTAVHVSRTLRHLAEDALIQFEGRRIVILNPDAVKRLAGVSDDMIRTWM